MQTLGPIGGWRLLPEREALAACSSWEEARQLLSEADELIRNLNRHDSKLRELYREQRRLELSIASAKRRARREQQEGFSKEAENQAFEAWERLADEHDDVAEEIERLEEARTELAETIERRYVPVKADRGALDLTPVDAEAVKDAVGQLPTAV